MEPYLKAVAMVLVAVVLTLFLGKWEKDYGVILSIAACCIAASIAVYYTEPVFSLLTKLDSLGNLPNGTLKILIKAVGIVFISEIAGMICSDSGNGSLGKLLNFLGAGAVLYLSLPIFESVLTLLTDIIGEL